MNIETVVVIGCGGIGRRWLEGIARSAMELEIFGVDPSAAARSAAADLLVADSHLQPVRLVASLDELPREVAVAVVATTADVRLAVLSTLSERSRSRYVVLEKFLFPSFGDYAQAEGPLVDGTAGAWVNCPRRLWSGYEQIARDIRGHNVLVEVELGERFPLGTTGIHFLDLFAFLAGRYDADVSADLDPGVLPGSRAGTVEFTGVIEASTPDGSRLLVRCTAGSPPLAQVTIRSGGNAWIVDELAGHMHAPDARPFPSPYQSELSGPLVNALLASGSCGLTPWKESAALHMALLRPFLDHYRSHVDPGAQACPVT